MRCPRFSTLNFCGNIRKTSFNCRIYVILIMGNHVRHVFSKGVSMVDTTGWSEMKKLKHRMLRRAFDENRGPQMILLIQWRKALTQHLAQKDVETLKKFEEKNEGQPRAIRALNMIEEMNGSTTFYKDSTVGVAGAETRSSAKDVFKMLAEQPEETRIIYRKKDYGLATMPALSADHYDPMEGVRPVSAYQLACKACDEVEQRVGDPSQRTIPDNVPKLHN